jgi:hypothetical protein
MEDLPKDLKIAGLPKSDLKSATTGALRFGKKEGTNND